MKNIIIFTAEPENFVPIELKKAADELNIDCKIIDIMNCTLIEGFDLDGNLNSNIYYNINDKEPIKLEISQDTIIIPRLNSHKLEIKHSIFNIVKKLGASFLNCPDSMLLCNNKLASQSLLNSSNIKTPFSFNVLNSENLKSILALLNNEIKYPIIVKMIHGSQGIGVIKIDSESSLISLTQFLLKEDKDFIIQEFIEHTESIRIIMLGDNLLAANKRSQANEDEFRTNSHLGSITEVYSPLEEELSLCKRIVELFGCNFCAIDFIIKQVDDKKIPIIFEVNGSPGLEAIQKNFKDRNLSKEIINYLINKEENFSINQQALISFKDNYENKEESTEKINPIENVILHKISEIPIEARIDTGAKTSSLHVDELSFDENWVKFKRNDIVYKITPSRFITIKNKNDEIESPKIKRPVIKLDITIKGKRLNNIEFNLVNRNNMNYQILIGRNTLSLLNLPIVVPPKTNINKEEE